MTSNCHRTVNQVTHATAAVDAYGTGSVTLGGTVQHLVGKGELATQATVLDLIVEHASRLGVPVVLAAAYSDGERWITVYPDASVEQEGMVS